MKRSPIRRKWIVKRFKKRRDPHFMVWMDKLTALVQTRCETHGQNCEYWPYNRALRAHLIPRSRGGEDKGNVVFLCRKHHDQQEKRTDAFNREHNIDLYARAKRWAERYDNGFELVESA